jgi:heptosyltransferase-3
MTIQRFTEIWSYRFRKFSHIFQAWLLSHWAWLGFWLKKRTLPTNTQLIAIVRTEHFGDIVAAEPLSRHIRELYPNAYLVWFVKPAFREIIDTNPAINETFPEFCVTQRRILFNTGVFDHIHELQFKNNNECPVCEKQYENPIAKAAGINVHTYFNYGNLLQTFTLSGGLSLPSDDQPRLYLEAKHRDRIDQLGLTAPFIVIHTCSNYAPKDWPSENWDRLVNELIATFPYTIVEVGLTSCITIQNDRYLNLCKQLSLLETGEIISRANFFIGLDSGPSHLANATGTFGFILMGAIGDFPSYNPYSGYYGRSDRSLLIKETGKACAQLPYEMVRDQIIATIASLSQSH